MDTPKIWIIYCHTHIESSRRYIGMTSKTMSRRWHEHIQNSKHKNGKGCRHFWNAIRKYGKDAFSHRVLEICSSLEEANEAEQAWIESFSSTNPKFGFNLMRGGYKWIGLTVDAKAESSARAKKLWQNPEYRARVSAAMKIMSSDPVNISALVARNKSRIWSDEARFKLSEFNKNRVCSEGTRQKISRAGMGRKPPNLEQLRAMGAAHSAVLRARTLCKHGHSLVDAYIRKSDGERICRTCSRNRKVQRRSLDLLSK